MEKSDVMTPIELKKAVLLIIGSVLLISGTATAGLFYFYHLKRLRAQDPAYKIVAIIQTTADSEPLKTVYFAELLGLSVDHPSNLYSFSARDAEIKLRSSPVIENVQVKKVHPGTIYIDYHKRTPLCLLAECANAAMDHKGYVFPLDPFFTPKKLPEVVLGLIDEGHSVTWGEQLSGERITLALKLLQELQENLLPDFTHVTRLDVSQAFASSYGQRQIILEVEESLNIHPEVGISSSASRTLRLSSDGYKQSLQNYQQISEFLRQSWRLKERPTNLPSANLPLIIDLRLPELAYISGRAPSSNTSR